MLPISKLTAATFQIRFQLVIGQIENNLEMLTDGCEIFHLFRVVYFVSMPIFRKGLASDAVAAH